MDFSHLIRACCASCALTWGAAAPATEAPPPDAAGDYQIKRLMTPGPADLAAEARGGIYIYDSLDIRQVDAALDQHFDRIENMMFIRIHHPQPSVSGPVMVEDDGCD